MMLQGYRQLEKKTLRFDVGIKEKKDQTGNLSCTLITPRPGKAAASLPWTPFDFYGNTLSEPEHKDSLLNAQKRRDIFFVGDDFNRNGRKDSVEWTMDPHPAFAQSLHFSNFLPFRDQFQFSLQFSRGTRNERGLLQFAALLGVSSYVGVIDSKELCWAKATLCTHVGTDSDGKPFCSTSKEHPIYEVARIRAQFDYPAAAKDYMSSVVDERQKHDVKELLGDVRVLSADGTPIGPMHEISLAKKIYYKTPANNLRSEEMP